MMKMVLYAVSMLRKFKIFLMREEKFLNGRRMVNRVWDTPKMATNRNIDPKTFSTFLSSIPILEKTALSQASPT